MFRIDHATAAAALPADDPTGTPGYFTKGNPATGTLATRVTANFLNSVQEEICNVIVGAGIALAKATKNQLLAAINVLITNNGQFGTGDVKMSLKSAADTGWVMMNDGSIGNGSSGATTRANADTSALFTLIWTNVSNANAALQDSSGNPTARGGSAAADFAANRRLVLPKALGRALAVAGAGSGLTSRALGDTVGEELHTLTTGEMPAHTHTIAMGNTAASGGTFSAQGQTSVGNLTTGSNGSGTPHNVMQPTSFLNVMIKL